MRQHSRGSDPPYSEYQGNAVALYAQLVWNPASTGGDELAQFKLYADGLAVMADGPWCKMMEYMQKSAHHYRTLTY